MPRRPRLDPIQDPVRNRWRLDVPASVSDSGKRQRCYFKTREAARDFVEKLRTGTVAAISPTLASEASMAKELAGGELTLVEIVRAYQQARQILLPTGASLTDAVQAYLEHWQARRNSVSLAKAVGAFMTHREQLRPKTLHGYKWTLEKRLAPLHGTLVAEIQAADVVELIEQGSTTSFEQHRRNFRAFWNWCSKPPRQWCDKALTEHIENRRTVNDDDIAVLTPDEVRTLLATAEKYSHSAAAAFAMAIFGGIRMEELKRLEWKDVGEEHIEIGKSVAKKHSRRLVPVCKTLSAWLKAHRAGAKGEQSIVPDNWAEVSKAVRRLAGWDVAAALLSKPPEATRGPWSQNACRHTCASVLVATGTSLQDLVFSFGHSGGVELLRRHYLGRMTRKQAIKILSIGPRGKKIAQIEKAA